jgi:hypothetical protein
MLKTYDVSLNKIVLSVILTVSLFTIANQLEERAAAVDNANSTTEMRCEVRPDDFFDCVRPRGGEIMVTIQNVTKLPTGAINSTTEMRCEIRPHDGFDCVDPRDGTSDDGEITIMLSVANVTRPDMKNATGQ